jgi:L-lysine exporter family protein LysE/ArgO
VALVCALSDAALIALGVSGLGALLHAVPWLIDAVRWAGAAFLTVYAALAARRRCAAEARRSTPRHPPSRPISFGRVRRDRDPHALAIAPRAGAAHLSRADLAEPARVPRHGVPAGFGRRAHGETRWVFAAGAVLASFMWFFALALGARSLGRWLATPRAWRILDGIIAVVMLAIA